MKAAWFVSLVLLVIAPLSMAEDQSLAMENSWGSEAKILDADTLRISTRKRIAGDLEEINRPGTSAYETFQRLQQVTLLRAAMECHHLGFDLFTITGSRDITTQRERNRVSGNAKESDFTMAPGQYQAEIDLGIQVTIDLLHGPMPDPRPEDTFSATEILIANGLFEATPADDQN